MSIPHPASLFPFSASFFVQPTIPPQRIRFSKPSDIVSERPIVSHEPIRVHLLADMATVCHTVHRSVLQGFCGTKELLVLHGLLLWTRKEVRLGNASGESYFWHAVAFFHEHNYGLFTFHRFPADFHHHSPGMSFEEFEFLSELKTKFETFLTKFTHRKSFICPVGVPRSFLAARHGIFWMKLNMLGNSIARDWQNDVPVEQHPKQPFDASLYRFTDYVEQIHIVGRGGGGKQFRIQKCVRWKCLTRFQLSKQHEFPRPNEWIFFILSCLPVEWAILLLTELNYVRDYFHKYVKSVAEPFEYKLNVIQI